MSEGMSEKLKACPGAGNVISRAMQACAAYVRDLGSILSPSDRGVAMAAFEAGFAAATRPAESALSVSREAIARALYAVGPIRVVGRPPLTFDEVTEQAGRWVEPGDSYKRADAILALTTPESANVGEVGHLRAFVARIADTKRSNPGGVSDSQYNAKIVREWRRDARNLIDILQTGAK